MSLSSELSGAESIGRRMLGDNRRFRRFDAMLHELVRRPAGKVSDVFRTSASRQGAYDLLEHETVRPESVEQLASTATAVRCRGLKSAYMVLDGSSITLTDEGGTKDLGSIGNHRAGARGVKLLNALILDSKGRTVGIGAQVFWVRTEAARKGYRPLASRESFRWHQAFDRVAAAFAEHAKKTALHVLGDREADATYLMKHILDRGFDFTIRANGTRKVRVGGKRVLVRSMMRRRPVIARSKVEVRENGNGPARTAILEVRAARAPVELRDHHTQVRTLRELTIVWAREPTAPRNGKRVEWLLYTSVADTNPNAALRTLHRYAYRWRIEDFHRLLKRGGGRVEDSQLRSLGAVRKWATLHAMVASRAQCLRDSARTNPDAPATTMLSEAEIEALVLIKTREKRRTETVTAERLTIRQAVRWIGDLGGFTATGVSPKMPGNTVVERGLLRVVEAVDFIAGLRAMGKMR